MLDPNQLASARLRKVATRVRHADGTVVIEQGGTVVGEEPSDATLIAAAVDESVVFVADTHVAIGAHDAALSWAALSGAGITHVLNVAFGIDAFPGRLVYLDVPLLDTDETELTAQVLERCFAFMDGADGRRVLVHCAHRVFVRPCFSLFPGNMGVSRSATVVIAWLMLRRGMRLQDAMAACKAARPCARPNAGFWRQLQALDQRPFE